MNELLKLFIKTLWNYCRSRGLMIASLSSAAGQEVVKIEVHSLFWYYRGSPSYPKFMYMYRELCMRYGDVVDVLGYSVRLYRDYIVVPVDLIKHLLSIRDNGVLEN